MKMLLKRTLSLVLVSTVVLFASCSDSIGGEAEDEFGHFTISLSGNANNSRNIYPPNLDSAPNPLGPDLEDLSFVVTFTRVGGAALPALNFTGATRVQGTVPVGRYTVTMAVYWYANDPAALYAWGSAENGPVEIRSGNNNDISVLLYDAANARSPVISVQPVQPASSFTAGGTGPTLSVTALPPGDGGTLTFEWFRNSIHSNTGGTAVGFSDGAIFDTTTGSSFTPNIPTSGDFYYYVVVTNTNASATGIATASVASNAVRVEVSGVGSSEPDILFVPRVAIRGPITLNGTSVNTDAPDQTISWTVEDAGTTGALISQNAGVYTMTTTGPGNVVVKGSAGTFTKEYTIRVFDFDVGANVVVVIKEDATPPTITGHASLSAAFTSIGDNAGTYTVLVDDHTSLFRANLPGTSTRNITLRPLGDTAEVQSGTSSGANSPLISVSPGFNNASNVTLTLEGNLTLRGRSDSWSVMTIYGSGGILNTGTTILNMGRGVVITGNSSTIGGGGVFVSEGATFNMYGGEIIENTTVDSGGGGVHISGGTFNMYGGKISKNTAASGGGGVSGGNFNMYGGEISENNAVFGGGVSPNNFNMYGGKIYDNTATTNGGGGNWTFYSAGSSIFNMHGGEIYDNTAANGGGVHISGNATGSANMYGGKIYDNTATDDGGGVYKSGSGIFNMHNGEIYENKAKNGGGVYKFGSSGTFNMLGGAIYRNDATDNGGGVGLEGPFNMISGTIRSNTAVGNGGGVFVDNGSSSRFYMAGGTIFGSSASGDSNTVTGEGAALFRSTNGVAQTGTLNGTIWSDLVSIPGNNSVTGDGIAVDTDITVP